MAEPLGIPGQLNREECRTLAEALPDTPVNVIPAHLLRRGFCDAYVSGDLESFEAAVVRGTHLPEEPFGLGKDHRAIWDILRPLEGWTCVDVEPAVAPLLGALIRDATGKRVCYYGDIYHTLTKPAATFQHESVRLLTLDDLPLLLKASGVDGASFGGLGNLLTEAVVAGAVVSGRVVGVAQTNAITERYGDIGVSTDEAFRGSGLATAATSIVARHLQEAGRIPVWSCGEDNMPSLRVAQKLGFKEVSRLTYVIRGDQT